MYARNRSVGRRNRLCSTTPMAAEAPANLERVSSKGEA
jgi:hypothetical protein